MQLSAPKQIVFLIAMLAIVVGIVFWLVGWPNADGVVAFWVTAAGGVLLGIGNLFKGI